VGGVALLASTFAALISGAREAYIFVPLTIGLTVLLDRGVAGVIPAISAVIAMSGVAVAAMIGLPLFQMYRSVGELLVRYSQDAAYGPLAQAISEAPFGLGTGTDTGAARYAMNDPSGFIGLENYFAKAAIELGIAGLIVVICLFLTIIVLGYRAERRMKDDPSLRCCGTSILAFLLVMFVKSFKGWQIDLDPINVYYWLFAGLMLRLPSLAAIMESGLEGQSARGSQS
jgi:cell division protein FtsW (lipid II flippase)